MDFQKQLQEPISDLVVYLRRGSRDRDRLFEYGLRLADSFFLVTFRLRLQQVSGTYKLSGAFISKRVAELATKTPS